MVSETQSGQEKSLLRNRTKPQHSPIARSTNKDHRIDESQSIGTCTLLILAVRQ